MSPKGPVSVSVGTHSPHLARTRFLHFAVSLFLLALVLSGYVNTLQNNFVWDDTQQVLRNSYIRPGTPWLRLFSTDVWAFSHPGESSRNNYYRPLQMVTYRVTAEFFGFSAPAFHSVSLAFHFLATLLAYAVLYELTRRVTASMAAAALFALHPIHSEAVDWVSALSELGCAVFFLLAFYLVLLARRPSAARAGEQPEGWFRRPELWILSWVSFALALLWKEMALTLPILIACYLVFCESHALPVLARLRRVFWVTLPYWAVIAVYLSFRHHALGFLYVPQRKWVLSPIDYVLTVIQLAAKYWWKLLFPLHLNAYYVFDPVRSLAEPRALGAILFVLIVGSAIVYAFRRAPLAAFAASWVFVTLIPVLNLRGVGRNVFTERYLYIPSVGFCLLLVWLANKGFAMLPVGYRSWAGACTATLLLSLYMVQTVRRNTEWRDEFTLFSQTLEASPNSPDVQNGVAELLRSEKDDLEGAEYHYLRAAALAQEQDPPEWDQIDSACVGLALIYSQQGHFDKALGVLDKAQAADPTDARVQSALGGVLLQVGRWKEAQKILSEVLQINPNDENALNGLAIVAWQNEHQYQRALDYLQQALRAHPASDSFKSSLHNNLGAVYCEMGRCQEAIAHFQRAIELTPNDPEYHTNLGNALGAIRRFAEARVELQNALALAPGYAPARAGLSNLEEQEHQLH